MELRRQHRIVYQTKIRLRAPGRDDSVIARVQNLSPRGVYITGTELPAAGTEVQCRLILAGERRTLRGRVAWVRPASPTAPLRSPGAGIEFLDLGQRDTDLLHKLTDPGADERQPVDVWFEGMKAPIRCQAVVAGEGVMLATRLPFMRLNSPVRVSFGPHESTLTREGTLDSVMLLPDNADGIPHLQLNVSMAGLDVAQGTIELAPGAPQVGRTPDPSLLAGPSTVVDASVTAPAPATVIPGRSSGGAVDRDRTQRYELPRPIGQRLLQVRSRWRLHLRRAVHWLAQGIWRPAATGFAAGAVVVGLFGFVLRGELPAPVAAVPAVPAAVAAAPAVQAPAVQLPLVQPSVQPPPVQPPPAADAPALARQQGIEGATLVTDASGVRLTVPLLGTAKGAEQYRLVEPPGVAITMPRARPLLPLGVYRPGGGPVRMQVRRKPGGHHVRFFYDPRVFKGRLLTDGPALVLELERR